MKNIIVGISGASGTRIAAAVLKFLRDSEQYRSILILSDSARVTALREYPEGVEHLISLADEVCGINDVAASVSSGTFVTEGMIVVPCSMKTLSGIVSGYSDNLLLRAADVTIKEGRKLVLVPREAPMSIVHCRNLLAAAELGAVIIPPVMSFYNEPKSIDDMVNHIAYKVLERFGLSFDGMQRWSGGLAVK